MASTGLTFTLAEAVVKTAFVVGCETGGGRGFLRTQETDVEAAFAEAALSTDWAV